MGTLKRARTFLVAAGSLLTVSAASCSAVDDSPYAGSWVFDFNPTDEEVDNETCPIDSNGNFNCELTWGSGDPAIALGEVVAGNASGSLRLNQAGATIKSYEISGVCATLRTCAGDLLDGSTGAKSGTFTMTQQ